MQVVIKDFQNKRPKHTVPPDICVAAGTKIVQDIFAVNPSVNPVRAKSDGDSTKIEAFSEVFNTIAPQLATYSPGQSVWQTKLSEFQQSHIKFNWQTGSAHVKEQPY